METSQPFESAGKTFLKDSIQPNEETPHGHPELVNFSSAAQVFHAVFENSYHANCIGNGHGKILEANETVCKIFGYTQKEMTGLSEKDIFDTTDSNYVKCLDKRDSDEKIKAVVTGIRKNRERFLCNISSVIFTDDNGERRTINTIHDISKNQLNVLTSEKIVTSEDKIFLVDG